MAFEHGRSIMRSHHRSILAFPLVPLATLLMAGGFAYSGPAAEELHISGRVVRADTDAPLSGVQVYIPGTRVGALTDGDGRYALDLPRVQLAQPDIHVVVALVGYHAVDSLVHVPDAVAGSSLTIDFRLKPEPVALNELVVTGATGAVSRQESAKVVDAARSPVERRAGATVTTPLRPAATQANTSSTAFAGKTGGGWYGPRRYRAPTGDREEYAHITDNSFRSAEDHPLSTFSIDVDRASYSNVRRFLLRERRLPPVDAVQIEEMVNYFSYHYDLPRGNDPVAVTTEVGAAPWAPDHRLLRIGIASRPVATADLPPANLVFLLDVSGSMASPDKLPLVKASMRLLVQQLRPVDRVAIVVYAGAAGLVLEPTSGRQKGRILEAIDRLQAGGSTAGGAGLRLAYDVARRSFRRGGNNRVILATDGDFNVGESSDAAMIRLIEEKRAQGTFLTVLGFGTGNLQSEKMQELAQHGNGNYAYIDGLQEARKVLVHEMGGTLLTVAKDVKVQIEFNPARVQAYRLLGYENRLLAAEDFNNDAKDAGDLGAGHTVTALYEVVPAGVESEEGPGSVDPLRYRTQGRVSREGRGDELAFVKIRYKRPHGAESHLLQHAVRDGSGKVSTDFTFASAVAGFGMLLRNSPYRGCVSADQVLALAEDGLGDDPEGYRHGFLELVRAYEALTQRDGWEDVRR
jgi:Ca-activated chloride channel family protein